MSEGSKIPVIRRRPVSEPKGTEAGQENQEGAIREGLATSSARSSLQDGSRQPGQSGSSKASAGRNQKAKPATTAIAAPREEMITPSRPILREAPIVPPKSRSFGKRSRRYGPRRRRQHARFPRPPRFQMPPKPRPPEPVEPIDERMVRVLRAVVDMTARNAALPRTKEDPDFVPGAGYRDIRRALALTWPEVRSAVRRMKPHGLLKVARFYGRFGPIFVATDYGQAVLEAAEAGQPFPEPPEAVKRALGEAKLAWEKWQAEHAVD
ncbi:MAG: hypothetical protein NZM37_01480 [Sandaracinaceae bacterium]|nr:hypothetical protein [Sandaracinaceae bacterium]